MALVENLADLVFQILATDQNVVAGRTAHHQSAVACQNCSPLLRGEGDEGAVLDLRQEPDIVPENDQPLGQGSQHAIGEESHPLPGSAGGGAVAEHG